MGALMVPAPMGLCREEHSPLQQHLSFLLCLVPLQTLTSTAQLCMSTAQEQPKIPCTVCSLTPSSCSLLPYGYVPSKAGSARCQLNISEVPVAHLCDKFHPLHNLMINMQNDVGWSAAAMQHYHDTQKSAVCHKTGNNCPVDVGLHSMVFGTRRNRGSRT